MNRITQVDLNININHLTRVEGHGNIVVNVKKGVIEKCQWQVPEAPRFFEAMVRERDYTEIARITSRICGICSIGHTLASVKATEQALGMQISPQSRQLRQLLKHAENFDSHILHVYLLAAPDLLGAQSVFPILDENPELIARALKLKRIAHEWGSLIAGRTTHPTRVVPGGFSRIPEPKQLLQLKQKLTAIESDIDLTVKTLLSLVDKIPDFNRPTEYISLADQHSYALYDGDIQSSLSGHPVCRYPVNDYLTVTNEYIASASTAKYCKNRSDSYMVGALARLNNNYRFLTEPAKQTAQGFGLDQFCTNPYMNTIAQVVELVNDYHTAIDLLDELLSSRLEAEPLAEITRYGNGKAAVEVPRGILFHEYDYDEHGVCRGGNFVIPTNQNHANIQHDFNQLLPQLIQHHKTQQQIELDMEMLVRAYDPCISCSAHFLSVTFV